MSKSFRVLVVDDSADLLHLAVRSLRAAGYVVVAASNGNDALAILRKDRNFDLIVSDLQMPVLTGPDLFRQLSTAGIEIPFVLCSSEIDMGRMKVAKLGMEAFLPKPYLSSELVDVVKSHTSANSQLRVS